MREGMRMLMIARVRKQGEADGTAGTPWNGLLFPQIGSKTKPVASLEQVEREIHKKEK